MTRAVVFAYHNVGVRCLRVLLAHGLDIPLVVTHADSPGETIWFGSGGGVWMHAPTQGTSRKSVTFVPENSSGSTYPALRAARMDPSQALRHI